MVRVRVLKEAGFAKYDDEEGEEEMEVERAHDEKEEKEFASLVKSARGLLLEEAERSGEAVETAAKRITEEIDREGLQSVPTAAQYFQVGAADFEVALKHLSPAVLREGRVEVPQIKWDAIGGLEEVRLET